MSVIVSDGYCSLTESIVPAASAAGFSIGDSSSNCMDYINTYLPGKKKCKVKRFLKRDSEVCNNQYLWISLYDEAIRLKFSPKDSLKTIFLDEKYRGSALNKYKIGDPIDKIQKDLGLWWCDLEEMFYPDTEKYPELVGLSFLGSSCESLEDGPEQFVSGFCVYNWDLE